MVRLTEIRKKVGEDFVKASKEWLTPPVFFESTKVYSGSISPHLTEEVNSWMMSGAIPPERTAEIYTPATIADLSGIGSTIADKPELLTKFRNIYEENKEDITQYDLYTRVSEYQDALMRLVVLPRYFKTRFLIYLKVTNLGLRLLR